MDGVLSGYKFISVNFLYEGLVLDKDVYDSSGSLTLLTKNTVLTDKHIAHLKQLKGADHNIRVSVELHRQLMDKGLPGIYEQEYLENNIGYSATKKKTADMFQKAESSGNISYDNASDISEAISDKLEKVDPALIFQCINGHNEVDEYLYRHSVNVALINGLMGKWLKFLSEEISFLVIGGLMHDIGKTRVPQDILNAQRKLKEDEFEIVKRHARYSFELMSNNQGFNDVVCLIALHHHERMNGSGYPGQLVADHIPLYARITAIADVYDAMVSKRCYKKANSPFKILSALSESQFSDLDMRLVEVFTRMMPFELIGKTVLMSDGSCATVRHVDPQELEFPYVEISSNIIKTDDKLYCVSMIPDELDYDFSQHFTSI